MSSVLHRIAHRLVVGIAGTELTPDEERCLGEEPPAGVILFSRNVSSSAQLAALTERIREVTAGDGGLDPLIMADHEGGRISVLSCAIGAPPSQAAVARTGSLKLSRSLYREVASDLRALGLNVLLGPVADVNTEPLNPVIGTRSFGEDPARVAVLVRESVIEIQRGKVAACIKHFPGHGSTSDDSHLSLPVVKRTPAQLKELDRPPFGAGVWAGASMVMMGHIVPPEGVGPATYESGIIAGTLREELGFDGVVITDALEMTGARVRIGGPSEGPLEERPLAEIVELSLKAGNDLLLFSKPVREVYRALEELGRLQELSHGFWDETFPRMSAASAARVRALRDKYAHRGGGELRVDRAGKGLQVISGKIAKKSIFVDRDPRSMLPIALPGVGSILFAGERSDFQNDTVRRFIARVMALCRAGRPDLHDLDDCDTLHTSLDHSTLQSDGMEMDLYRHGPEKDAGGPNLLFLLNRRSIGEALVSRVAEKADIVIVTDWPYVIDLLPEDKTVIMTYGIYEAAADAVFGATISRS